MFWFNDEVEPWSYVNDCCIYDLILYVGFKGVTVTASASIPVMLL